MSALTLFSVPAIAVSGPPQGSSGEAASGFQAMLAAETGERSSLPEATAGPVADPATAGAANDDAPVAPDASPGKDDALSASSEASGFPPAAVVMRPPPPSTPPRPTFDGVPAVEADGVEAGDPDPRNSAPESAVDRSEGVQGPILPPAGKVPPPGTNGPQPQPQPQPEPRLTNDRAPPPPEGESRANMAGSAVLTEVDLAGGRTGSIPVVASPPMPAPAPLRPLAERTSRPLEGPVAGTGDAPRAGESAPVKAVAPTPAVTAPPAGFREAITATPVAAPSSEGAPAGFAPTGDGAAAGVDTPAITREAPLSQLSRVTIEATAQIAAQILRRLEGRSTRFEIALTPAELGRVDVKLDIDSEGRLNARLAFDNPAAATDLRGRADELRRQLEDAGFHLGEDALEFAERDSGSSAFDRGQNARDGQSRAFTAAARLNAEIDVAQPPRWMALSLSPSGVDMKV
jgi:flagellar hook-length control protein FliK